MMLQRYTFAAKATMTQDRDFYTYNVVDERTIH